MCPGAVRRILLLRAASWTGAAAGVPVLAFPPLHLWWLQHLMPLPHDHIPLPRVQASFQLMMHTEEYNFMPKVRGGGVLLMEGLQHEGRHLHER